MKITTKELTKNIENFSAGDRIELTGTIYTARDQAHKRLIGLMEKNEKLPLNLKNASIYYCGPCPNAPDKIIGSCGPTTSSRMDVYTPKMLDNGVKLLIGKGKRSDAVINSVKKNKALYLLATGGVGALIAERVKSFELTAFPDLGPEAIYKIEIEDFPLTVGIDTKGTKLI